MKLRLIAMLRESVRESLRELARESIHLARDEAVIYARRLARESRPLRGPAIKVAAGVVMALFSAALLIAALVLGLAVVMPAWCAALVVGLMLGVGAAVLLRHVRHPSWTEVKLLPPEPPAE